HNMNSSLTLRHTTRNQALLQLLQSNAGERGPESTHAALPHLVHGFGQIPVQPFNAGALQTKLTISNPGDEYEQEADQIAEHVLRMPEPQIQRACACGEGSPDSQEEKILQPRISPGVESSYGRNALRAPEATVDAVRVGQPLTHEQKSFFE